MLTASADASLRYWEWEGKRHVGNRVKLHAYGPGDSITSVAALYNTTVEQLVEWNEIPDVLKIYEGQQLIVQVVGEMPKRPPKKPLPELDPELKQLLVDKNAKRKRLGKKMNRWKDTAVGILLLVAFVLCQAFGIRQVLVNNNANMCHAWV